MIKGHSHCNTMWLDTIWAELPHQSISAYSWILVPDVCLICNFCAVLNQLCMCCNLIKQTWQGIIPFCWQLFQSVWGICRDESHCFCGHPDLLQCLRCFQPAVSTALLHTLLGSLGILYTIWETNFNIWQTILIY